MSRHLRSLIRLGLFLALLAGLAVIGDRVGDYLTEQSMASRLETALHSKAKPSVRVHGFPWALQAMSRRFDHVSVDARDVTLRGFPVSRLTAELRAVQVDERWGHPRAESLAGRALASWADLTVVAKTPIGDGGDGRVKVSYDALVFGQQMTIVVTAVPVLDLAHQRLELTAPALSVDGISIPQNLAQELIAHKVRPITLPMPGALRATSLTVAADGVTLGVEGSDVPLTGLG